MTRQQQHDKMLLEFLERNLTDSQFIKLASQAVADIERERAEDDVNK
jgi:hypothetical protein